MSKIKVAVIFGGASSEHDISLISATNVIENMPKDKYEAICIGITKKGRWLYYPGDVSNIASGEWEKDPDCSSAVISPDPLHKGVITLENGEYTIRKVDVVFPVLRLYYTAKKMLARKGIFARPSMPQSCAARGGDSRKGLRRKTFLWILYHTEISFLLSFRS